MSDAPSPKTGAKSRLAPGTTMWGRAPGVEPMGILRTTREIAATVGAVAVAVGKVAAAVTLTATSAVAVRTALAAFVN